MDEPIIPPTKTCTKCKQELPTTLEYFYAKKRGLYGLYAHCKACHSKITAPRASAWNRAHPERVRESLAKYERANSEKRKAKDHNRYLADPKKAYERLKQARINNPLMHRAAEHRRRARKQSAKGTHTKEDIARLIVQSKGRCYWCGKKIKGTPHIDHIFALARGGSNGPENLCVSCPTCNTSKGAKLPHEWSDRLF
jgi:5-methylcytosine-specific restriction endonuclease McrA